MRLMIDAAPQPKRFQKAGREALGEIIDTYGGTRSAREYQELGSRWQRGA
jgi:hypothetical protein